MTKKQTQIKKIISDIKALKIQGATNIAKAGLETYLLNPTKKTKQKILSARATEPLLKNVLEKADKTPNKKILQHLKTTQQKIKKSILKLIKNNYVIFTHCHSSTVVNALIYAKKKKKKFEVYNTETRPLYQGRKTARELKKAGIKVTQFIDSAARIALIKSQETKKVDLVFFGADAITKKGVINKIGSGMFSQIAYDNKIPVYILADSWKVTKSAKLEQRDPNEIWRMRIKIKNPAFELIPKKFIKGIVSEKGILSYEGFLKKVIT